MQTISLFNSLISTQLTAGQDNVEYVQDSFRINSVKMLRGYNSSLQVISPSTLLERSNNARASSVTIESDSSSRRMLSGEGDASSEEEFSVSFVSTSASSYGDLGLTFNTNPVQVTVSRSSATATRVTFVLVHNEAVSFTSSAEAAAMGFNTTCAGPADFSHHSYTCPLSGEVLEHKCAGEAGVLSSYCPVLAPSCAIFHSATASVDTSSSLCEVVSYTLHETVCSCVIEPGTSGGRRLEDSSLAQSGVLDAVSISVYVASEFTDTFSSTDDMTSLAALRRVLIVIIMFSTLWAGGLFLVFGCTWRRSIMKKVNAKTGSNLQKKMQTAQVSRSPAVVRQYLTDYISETFPSVFSNKPFFSRLYGEITRHHRYLTLFTAPEGDSGDKQRILTSVELLTVQTMLMFLLSLLYDIQAPNNDGSCAAHTDEMSCLHRKSVFDNSQSYCQWSDASQADQYSCSYADTHFSFKVVIYIAVIVSILVSLISHPIDKIFELLSAPVADEAKAATQDTALKRIGRRASNAAASVARRASNVALNIASAARTKLNKANSFIVGTVTRKIPGTTQSAHDLAAASMIVIAENNQRHMQQRQLARMQSYQQSGGKFGNADSNSNSDSDSDDSNSSGSERDEETRGGEVVRPDGITRNGSGSSTRSAIQTQLAKLSEEVHCQRRLLKPSELDEFDTQWGLDPTGEFTHGERSRIPVPLPVPVPCLQGKRGAEDIILAELKFVKEESTKKAEKLGIATDAHTGLEILHLFIIDLLGRNTPAAIIFETKSEEDFKHTKVVTRTSKRLAALALVAVNAFFIYYAMLTGYRKGIHWQQVYLMACIAQFVVEIVLFETMECVWINCCIPVLVSDEVRRVGESITEVVQHLCVGTQADSRLFLNAPDYLFVSTNLAKKFPHLMESILVQAYTNHVPGELSRKWQVGSVARFERHQRLRNITLLTTILGVLQYLGTAPFVVHRMFIRFVQPFVSSGLLLLWILVVSDTTYIGIAAGVLAVVTVYIAYKWYLDHQKHENAKIVTPILAEYQTTDDEGLTDSARKMSVDDALHLPSLPQLQRFMSVDMTGMSKPSASSAESKDGGEEEQNHGEGSLHLPLRARTISHGSDSVRTHGAGRLIGRSNRLPAQHRDSAADSLFTVTSEVSSADLPEGLVTAPVRSYEGNYGVRQQLTRIARTGYSTGSSSLSPSTASTPDAATDDEPIDCNMSASSDNVSVSDDSVVTDEE